MGRKKKQENPNIQKIIKKYKNNTWEKYTVGITDDTLQLCSDSFINNAIEWFKKYYTEIYTFLYCSDEIEGYAMDEVDTYSDIMIEFNQWQVRYEREKLRRQQLGAVVNGKSNGTIRDIPTATYTTGKKKNRNGGYDGIISGMRL